MSIAKVKRAPYGVQIVLDGGVSFEEVLWALEQALELHAKSLGVAAINLGWREVNVEQMRAIQALFQKVGVRLLGVISTSLISNRSAAELGYPAVIGRVGLAKYRGGRSKRSRSSAEAIPAPEVERSIEVVLEGRPGANKSESQEIAARLDSALTPSTAAPARPVPALEEPAPPPPAKKRTLAPSLPKDAPPEEEVKGEGGQIPAQTAARLGRVIILTSARGGQGLSTCTAHLGAALARLHHSVVLVDGGGSLGNLDLLLGLENPQGPGVVDLVNGSRRHLRQVLTKDRRFERLFLLPAAPTFGRDPGASALAKLCQDLQREFDFVLLDYPGLRVEKEGPWWIPRGESLLLATPQPTGKRSLQRLGRFLSQETSKLLLLGNLFPAEAKAELAQLEEQSRQWGGQLLGVLPQLESGAPLPELEGEGEWARAFTEAAQRLIDPQEAPLQPAPTHGTWLSKLGEVLGAK